MKIINRYFWVAAIVSLLLDVVTKKEIVRIFDIKNQQEIVHIFWLNLSQSIVRSPNPRIPPTLPLIPDIFHFTYLRNCGAAFSFWDGNGGSWLACLSLVVSIILILVGIYRKFGNIWEQLGFGLILAGAAGNGIDRLFFGGCVADFIELRIIHFAIFNWADISINIGVVCLLICNFIYRSPQPNSRA